jgi:citrate lyase beta subunit
MSGPVHRLHGFVSAVGGLRSLLFVPADDAERAERAFDRGADAVFIELEDGVAPAAKEDARSVLVRRAKGGRGAVRVTGASEEAR